MKSGPVRSEIRSYFDTVRFRSENWPDPDFKFLNFRISKILAVMREINT